MSKTKVNVDDLDIEAIEKKMAKMSQATANVLGDPKQTSFPKHTKKDVKKDAKKTK